MLKKQRQSREQQVDRQAKSAVIRQPGAKAAPTVTHYPEAGRPTQSWSTALPEPQREGIYLILNRYDNVDEPAGKQKSELSEMQ